MEVVAESGLRLKKGTAAQEPAGPVVCSRRPSMQTLDAKTHTVSLVTVHSFITLQPCCTSSTKQGERVSCSCSSALLLCCDDLNNLFYLDTNLSIA